MTAQTKPKHERHIDYRDDGSVWLIYNFRHDMFHGRQTYYKPDGSVWEIMNYRNGCQHGPQYGDVTR